MREFGILLGAAMLIFTGFLMADVVRAGVKTTDIVQWCISYGGSWRCY